MACLSVDYCLQFLWNKWNTIVCILFEGVIFSDGFLCVRIFVEFWCYQLSHLQPMLSLSPPQIKQNTAKNGISLPFGRAPQYFLTTTGISGETARTTAAWQPEYSLCRIRIGGKTKHCTGYLSHCEAWMDRLYPVFVCLLQVNHRSGLQTRRTSWRTGRSTRRCRTWVRRPADLLTHSRVSSASRSSPEKSSWVDYRLI